MRAPRTSVPSAIHPVEVASCLQRRCLLLESLGLQGTVDPRIMARITLQLGSSIASVPCLMSVEATWAHIRVAACVSSCSCVQVTHVVVSAWDVKAVQVLQAVVEAAPIPCAS